MQFVLKGFVLVLVCCVSASAEQSRELVQRFNVGEQPQVRLDLSAAAIEVVTGAPGVVQMRTRMTLATDDVAKANAVFDNIHFDYTQSADQVGVKARGRKSMFWDWDPRLSVQTVIELTVPLVCNVMVDLGSGSVSLEKLDGNLSLKLATGNVFAQRIEGDARVRGERINVTLTEVAGTTDISVGTGQILIGQTYGPATLSSQGGVMEIQQAHGQVQAEASGGRLIVGFARPVKANSQLTTSGGDIVVKLERNADVEIAARASVFGQVRTRNLPMSLSAGKAGKSRLLAQVNEGGSLLALRASGGDVWLIGLEPL